MEEAIRRVQILKASHEVTVGLETFTQRLWFLRDRFITQSKDIKATRDVAQSGEEAATVEFDQVVFIGELNSEVLRQIRETLRVNLTDKPEFKLRGQFEFAAWKVPDSTPPLFLLGRYVADAKETEILAYEENMLDMFIEIEELEKISE
jgi:hypothetical protein